MTIKHIYKSFGITHKMLLNSKPSRWEYLIFDIHKKKRKESLRNLEFPIFDI